MIYVTSAANDDDLFTALGSLAVKAPIPHGDAIFFGVWEDDHPIRILVERKKIPDMVESVNSGRYLNQAQQAIDSGFEVLVLIVEGVVRPGRDGILEQHKTSKARKSYWVQVLPAMMYSRFDGYLSELAIYTGIRVKRSTGVKETAAQIKVLWQMFQKPPSDHQSLKQIWEPNHKTDFLKRPSLVRKVAAQFPGIGWGRSGAVDGHFKSVADMVNAGVSDWEAVPGIGHKTALTVTSAIQAQNRA